MGQHAKAYLSAEETPQATSARLPRPHADTWGQGDPTATQVQGPSSTGGLVPPLFMQDRLRLTGEKRFSSVFQEGRSWANPLLVLKVLPNGMDASRFGFSAGRRIGKAVTRNRVKRRLREGVRCSQVKSGWDVVLIARKGAASADFHQLKRSLDELLRRARLVERPGPGNGGL